MGVDGHKDQLQQWLSYKGKDKEYRKNVGKKWGPECVANEGNSKQISINP